MKKVISYILITAVIVQGVFGVFGVKNAYAVVGGGTAGGSITPEQQAQIEAEKTQNATYQKVTSDYDQATKDFLAAEKQYKDYKTIVESDAEIDRQESEQLEEYRQQALSASAKVNDLKDAKAEVEAQQAQKIEQDRKAAIAESRGCLTWYPPWVNPGACAAFILEWVANLLLQFVAVFLWIAGLLLNLVLDITLVHMKGTLDNISGINAAWTTIRDLANIFFIFSLLYIAITTILGLAHGGTKKVLAHLIIAALLINFSLFFTKVIVDASNILAFGFYKNMPGVGNFTDDPTAFAGKKFTGLSGSIMGSLKLQSIYDVSYGSQGATAGGVVADLIPGVIFRALNILTATLGGIIFIIVTIIVFLVTAFLFLIRFVLIVILMILSPLAFLGMVLPHFEEQSKKWWTTLMGQAIFAPALMMMIWVTLKVAGGMKAALNIKAEDGFGAVLLAHTGGSFNIIVNFIIIILMMIFSLIFAKKIGEAGGHGLMEYANRFQSLIARRAVRGVTIGKRIGFGEPGEKGKWGFDIPEKFRGEFGLRKLDEKFHESAFGKTEFGSALREYSTKQLAEAKWQGKMSAQESYEESKKFRAEREDLAVKDEVVGLVAEYKTANARHEALKNEYQAALDSGDEAAIKTKKGELDRKAKEKDSVIQLMQRKLSRIDAHDFAEIIPKHLFNDEDFMRNASVAQVLAVMDGERLETDEKEHMIAARNRHLTNAFHKLEERNLRYEELEKEFVLATTKEEEAKIMEQLRKEFKDGKAPDMSNTFPEIHKEMRAANLKDVELFYWANPEEFMKPGISSYRYSIIKGLRESSMVGRADSDHIRDLKPSDFIKASDELKGINAILLKTIRDSEGKIDKELEKVNESLREGMRDIYKKAYHAGEDLEKLFEREFEVLDYKGEAHKLKFNKKLVKDFGESNMADALSGKTYEEMRMFRNWLRNDPNIGRHLSRSHAVYIGRQDKDDVEQVVNHLLIERWKASQGGYEMSAENKGFLDWIESDQKEARSFLEDGYSYKLKDRNGNEITELKINRGPGTRGGGGGGNQPQAQRQAPTYTPGTGGLRMAHSYFKHTMIKELQLDNLLGNLPSEIRGKSEYDLIWIISGIGEAQELTFGEVDGLFGEMYDLLTGRSEIGALPEKVKKILSSENQEKAVKISELLSANIFQPLKNALGTNFPMKGTASASPALPPIDKKRPSDGESLDRNKILSEIENPQKNADNTNPRIQTNTANTGKGVEIRPEMHPEEIYPQVEKVERNLPKPPEAPKRVGSIMEQKMAGVTSLPREEITVRPQPSASKPPVKAYGRDPYREQPK